AASGDWEVSVTRCPPAPLVVSVSVNSLILDGSRWESEIDALRLDRLTPVTTLARTDIQPTDDVTLSYVEWLLWSACTEARRAGDIAAELACPELAILTAARHLIDAGLLRRQATAPITNVSV